MKFVFHKVSARRLLGLDRSHELLLLLGSLETTVTELGGGVDELEVDLLDSLAGGLGAEGLAEGDEATAGAGDGTLEEDVVLVDLTVVWETTERGDTLDGEIELSGGVLLGDLAVSGASSLTDAVDLLVLLGTVMVTVLTSAGNRVFDTARMPGTNTGDLTETLVGLARKLGHTPAGDDTLETLTLGDGNGVDLLVLLEDGADRDRLLKETLDERDLVSHGAAVDLDLTDVGLLLAKVEFADLGVDDGTHDGAVLLDALLLLVDAGALAVLLGVASEGLVLLRGAPVLVEPALALVGEMLGPDGAEGLEATRGLKVSDHTDHDERWALKDGHGLDDLLLVGLGASLVHITEDMGGTSLVAHEGGKVALGGGVIKRERLDLTLGLGATLLWEEPKGTMTWTFELTVRHF